MSSSFQKQFLFHFILAGNDSPRAFLSILVDQPGGPLTWNSVVHRIVNIQDVILLEPQMKRLRVVGHSVKHRLDIVAISRLVLDGVVPLRVELHQDLDTVRGLGEFICRLLRGRVSEVSPV